MSIYWAFNPNLTPDDIKHLNEMKMESFKRSLKHLEECANQIEDPLQRMEFISSQLPMLMGAMF